MSEKKEDLRIRRTHKLLCDAMFSLLENQSFDEISVVNICDKAMVHRATFYKHFKDKYEFMEYVTKEKLHEFYKSSKSAADFSDKKNLYRALISNILTFIENNKTMLRLISKSSNSNFFDSLQKIIYNELLDFLKVSQEKGETYKAPVDVYAKFLTGGLTALIRWWISTNTPYSKEDIAKHIECMLLISDSENHEDSSDIIG